MDEKQTRCEKNELDPMVKLLKRAKKRLIRLAAKQNVQLNQQRNLWFFYQKCDDSISLDLPMMVHTEDSENYEVTNFISLHSLPRKQKKEIKFHPIDIQHEDLLSAILQYIRDEKEFPWAFLIQGKKLVAEFMRQASIICIIDDVAMYKELNKRKELKCLIKDIPLKERGTCDRQWLLETIRHIVCLRKVEMDYSQSIDPTLNPDFIEDDSDVEVNDSYDVKEECEEEDEILDEPEQIECAMLAVVRTIPMEKKMAIINKAFKKFKGNKEESETWSPQQIDNFILENNLLDNHEEYREAIAKATHSKFDDVQEILSEEALMNGKTEED